MAYVLYVILNSDLKMRQGRAAAQVGHLVHHLISAAIHEMYEISPSQLSSNYLKWDKEQTIVVLQAPKTELLHLLIDDQMSAFYDSILKKGKDEKELTVIGGIFSHEATFAANYKLF